MEINLYNGDCLEIMDRLIEQGVQVDVIITDPPYGTTACKWDSVIDFEKMWGRLNQLIKPNSAIVLFGQNPYSSALIMSNPSDFRYEWVWEKTQATGHLNAKKMPLKAHENIMVFYKKLPTYNPQKTQGHKPINSYTKYVATQNNTDIYGEVKKEITGGGETDRYPRSVQIFSSDKQKDYLHPTQKPIALMEYLVKTYTNKGETVLDFTMGSGTTGVACKNLNRNFIGIELDENYFKIAEGRLNQKQQNQDERG